MTVPTSPSQSSSDARPSGWTEREPRAAMLSFIAVFGVSKAITNLFAGALGDRYGRKPLLFTGWLMAVPVPLLLMWRPRGAVTMGLNEGAGLFPLFLAAAGLSVGRIGAVVAISQAATAGSLDACPAAQRCFVTVDFAWLGFEPAARRRIADLNVPSGHRGQRVLRGAPRRR
jgi:MFS family permease